MLSSVALIAGVCPTVSWDVRKTWFVYICIYIYILGRKIIVVADGMVLVFPRKTSGCKAYAHVGVKHTYAVSVNSTRDAVVRCGAWRADSDRGSRGKYVIR